MKQRYFLKSQAGGSVVETLVVVAILAVIIVILVIVLNPLEQIRKATDDRKLAISRELSAAITRYQIGHNTRYPWNVQNSTYTPRVRDPGNPFDFDPTDPDQSAEWLWTLVEAEEMKKSSVQTMIEQGNWYVLKQQGTQEYAWVCFEPQAKANIEKAALECDTKASSVGRITPQRIRHLDPCDTIDGTLPVVELGERNLLCVQD